MKIKKLKIVFIVCLILTVVISLSACSLEDLRKDIIGIEIENPPTKKIIEKAIIENSPRLIFKNSFTQLDKNSTSITKIETVTTDLKQYETIYRVKHNSLDSHTEALVLNNNILVKRNLGRADSVLINKYGEYSNQKSYYSDINAGGLLDKSGKYYAYVEDTLSTTLPNTIIVFNLKQNRKQVVFSDISYSSLQSLQPIAFSKNSNILYALGLNKGKINSLFDIDLNDFQLTRNLFFDEFWQTDISIVSIVNDNLFYIKVTDGKTILYKANINTKNTEEIMSLLPNSKITKIMSSSTNDYFQVDNNIITYSPSSTYKVLENVNLTDISPDNKFLIYSKKATFNNITSFFIFYIDEKTSKEIYTGGDNADIEYIGMVE